MSQITLAKEKETLLIPLYGKAMDYQKKRSILNDRKAADIVDQIDFDFDTLKIQDKTNTMMCIRAKIIDDLSQAHIAHSSDITTVIHLGCGLDSRAERIDRKNTDWYEVDFPQVIRLRHAFYEEKDDYHLIGSSVTKKGWLDQIPNHNKHCVVIAEGLSMYLKEQEIKTLIAKLKSRLGRFVLIMDAYSELAAKEAKNHPSLKRTGAQIFWGIDDPKALESWGMAVSYVDSYFFTESRYLDKLSFGTRTMYGLANMIRAAKRAHRVLVYQVG